MPVACRLMLNAHPDAVGRDLQTHNVWWYIEARSLRHGEYFVVSTFTPKITIVGSFEAISVLRQAQQPTLIEQY